MWRWTVESKQYVGLHLFAQHDSEHDENKDVFKWRFESLDNISLLKEAFPECQLAKNSIARSRWTKVVSIFQPSHL